MPIQRRRIEVFMASDSTDTSGKLREALEKIGDFSLTWVTEQENVSKEFEKTKQTKGRIDLLVIHFCDSEEGGVDTLVSCFRKGLTALPTLFFVSHKDSCLECFEKQRRLQEALRMNTQDVHIVCTPDHPDEAYLEKLLRKILPQFKSLAA